MDLTKILYKIVENPKDLSNYLKLKEYFNQINEKHLEEAVIYLLEAKNATNNNNNAQ